MVYEKDIPSLTIPPYPPSGEGKNKRSEILYGIEKAVGRGVYFMSNVKERMDICFDHNAPSIVVKIQEYRNGYDDIRRRGGKIRAFTEITKDNVAYCKELLKLVDDLRHLDGVKGGIAVSETEYMATTILEEAKPLTQVIYSNVREVVEQGQYIFDTLWSTAIPAEVKIREIEEGITHYESKVLESPDEIIKQIVYLAETSTGLSIVSSFGGMQLIYNNFFDLYKKILDKYKKGEGKGIKWICSINEENIDLVKIFLKLGMQLRHVKSLTPMNFAIGDKELNATVESMEGGKMVRSLLTSNEPIYVKHFSSIFQELWNNGIDANDRIRDIEAGTDKEDIKIIQNPVEVKKLSVDLIKSAKEEVVGMFSTANAFRRQEYSGNILLLKELTKERGINVRILTPMDSSIEKTAQELRREQLSQKFNIRSVQPHLQTKVSILVIDKKYSLVVELKDDTKQTTEEAIGLGMYSNSKSTVLSYYSIFESLWKQTELYEQLEESNKQLELANVQLKINDKMQKEFINIAAHELRTPIQPILGLAEVLSSKKGSIEQYNELIDAIIRNARRLQRLTEDILDVTRIESQQSLIIKKEQFNLNDLIINTIHDMMIKREIENKNVKLLYKPNEEEDVIFLKGDSQQLARVIFNLVSNAIKFTSHGTILIKTNKEDHSGSDSGVIVSVKDTGSGIDHEILPRLFSKFATKSDKGTGLGLFISKNIIESHGGKIWAENNADRKGATFSFTLPINDQKANVNVRNKQ
jgi:two-component system sensor histidine kinase VicK